MQYHTNGLLRYNCKFKQYQEKIVDAPILEKKLKLFIEVRANTYTERSLNYYELVFNWEEETTSDLAFVLHQHFLAEDIAETPKMLLLTRQAWVGNRSFVNISRDILMWRIFDKSRV